MMPLLVSVMIFISALLSAEAFSTTIRTTQQPMDLSSSTHAVFASRPSYSIGDQRFRLAAKKGFGNVPESTAPKKKGARKDLPASSASAAANTPSKPTTTMATISETSPTSKATGTPSSSSSSSSLNPGQKALADMRRQKAEQKEAELRKVREMIRADQQVQESPAAIPERVAQRMGSRMLGFVGVPLLLGTGSFVAFWYFATYKNIEFQPALVAGTTIGILAISLLGITYSVMSTSWDEDREGDSILGVDEFQRNMASIKGGLDRSKENAVLRDKIQGVSPAELDRVMAALDEKEAKAAAKQQQTAKSLGTKLQEELE